jgi:hypothetical protein
MKTLLALVVAPLFVAACAETPKPDAPATPSPSTPASGSEAPAAPQATDTAPVAKVAGRPLDELEHATVLATHFDDHVELAVRLAAKPKSYGYDPVLTVGDRTLREYRYEDGDRTIVFVEAEPAKLPRATTVSLAFGHGSTVVQRAQLPLLVAPKPAAH